MVNQDILDEKMIKSLISSPDISVEVYDSIDSTNLELKRRIRDGYSFETADMLIVANEQTGGRGRLGRTFESPKGSGIYMSFHIKPRNMEDDVMLITTAAAVAVARGIYQTTGIDSDIKWVNDIYVGMRKVCGILAEAVTAPDGDYHIILGIGINIVMPGDMFGEGVRDIAGALFSDVDEQNVSRNEIAAAVADSFLKIYGSISDREYMEEYRKRSLVIGKEVRYLRENEWHDAVVTGIDDDGGLQIEENGVNTTLRTGEITLRLR